MSDLRYDELEAAHEKLCADFNELLIERDRLFDEAEAGFKIRDSRIAKLEELVLAVDVIEESSGGLDWFAIRDSLFS